MININSINFLRESQIFLIDIYFDNISKTIKAYYNSRTGEFSDIKYKFEDEDKISSLKKDEYVEKVLKYIKQRYYDNDYILNRYIEIEKTIKEFEIDNNMECEEISEYEKIIKINFDENSLLKYLMCLNNQGMILKYVSYLIYEEKMDGITYIYTMLPDEQVEIVKEKVLNSKRFRLRKILNIIK